MAIRGSPVFIAVCRFQIFSEKLPGGFEYHNYKSISSKPREFFEAQLECAFPEGDWNQLPFEISGKTFRVSQQAGSSNRKRFFQKKTRSAKMKKITVSSLNSRR